MVLLLRLDGVVVEVGWCCKKLMDIIGKKVTNLQKETK